MRGSTVRIWEERYGMKGGREVMLTREEREGRERGKGGKEGGRREGGEGGMEGEEGREGGRERARKE